MNKHSLSRSFYAGNRKKETLMNNKELMWQENPAPHSNGMFPSAQREWAESRRQRGSLVMSVTLPAEAPLTRVHAAPEISVTVLSRHVGQRSSPTWGSRGFFTLGRTVTRMLIVPGAAKTHFLPSFLLAELGRPSLCDEPQEPD